MHPLEQFLSQGYGVWKDLLPKASIYELIYNIDLYDYPDRGHDINGQYHEKRTTDIEWGSYWTIPLNNNPRVDEIRNITDRIASKILLEPVFYHSDISVLTTSSHSIRPHVDTPHRHEPWSNKISRTLGIQLAIPLQDHGSLSGTTAFLPNSHRRHWDIRDCYAGKYDQEFLENYHQPEIHFGDFLMWDARTLHSAMPNKGHSKRYMLLFNYLEKSIVTDVMDYEASLIA